MVEISHLTKKYGTHVAVDDLNLTIEPGRIYGFLGPNGAGKSTTMNMITGYLGVTVAWRYCWMQVWRKGFIPPRNK